MTVLIHISSTAHRILHASVVQQERACGSSTIPACSANTILLLLYVADFVVSLLPVASATCLAAAVIRSTGAGVTVGCCKRCRFLVRHTSSRQTKACFAKQDCSCLLCAAGRMLCYCTVARDCDARECPAHTCSQLLSSIQAANAWCTFRGSTVATHGFCKL